MKPRSLIKILIIILIIIWYIPRQTAPNGLLEKFVFLRWIILAIVPILITMVFSIKATKREKLDFGGILIFLPLIFLSALLSLTINSGSPLKMFGFLLAYLAYPILYVCLVNLSQFNKISDITEITKKYFHLFFFLLIMQVPECFYRFIFLGITGDHISFSLGPWGTTDLGNYMIYFLSFLFAFYLMRFAKFVHLISSVLIFILIAIIGEIKFLYISIPITFLFVSLFYVKSFHRTILAIMFILIFLILSLPFWEVSGSFLYLFLNNLMNFIENPIEASYMSGTARISAGIITFYNLLQSDVKNLVFGFGPGESFAGNIIKNTNIIVLKGWTIEQYINQFSALLVDIGILGLIIYISMFIVFLKHALFLLNNSYDKFTKAFALGYLGVWLNYVILQPWVNIVWRLDSASYLFYSFGFLIYKYKQNLKSKTKFLQLQKL